MDFSLSQTKKLQFLISVEEHFNTQLKPQAPRPGAYIRNGDDKSFNVQHSFSFLWFNKLGLPVALDICTLLSSLTWFLLVCSNPSIASQVHM